MTKKSKAVPSQSELTLTEIPGDPSSPCRGHEKVCYTSEQVGAVYGFDTINTEESERYYLLKIC